MKDTLVCKSCLVHIERDAHEMNTIESVQNDCREAFGYPKGRIEVVDAQTTPNNSSQSFSGDETMDNHECTKQGKISLISPQQ